MLGKVAKQKVLTKGKNGPQWMTKIEASFTQLINQAASGHLKALDLLTKMMISFPETVKPRDVEDKVSSAKAKLLKLLEARHGSFAEGAAEPDQPSGQGGECDAQMR
jgi:DNA polymerase III gamma/tau subunit